MSHQSNVEHVQSVLERYREFFTPEILDAKFYTQPRSTRTLTLLTPKQFQRLAFPLKTTSKKHFDKENRTNAAAGQWHELPYLKILVDRNSDEAVVIGHEGRHRTIYMQSRDMTCIPVVLWVAKDKETGKGERMYWGHDNYRPKLIRSQNLKWVMPMPHSLAFPQPLLDAA